MEALKGMSINYVMLKRVGAAICSNLFKNRDVYGFALHEKKGRV
jgi:hypothetical protein